MADSGGTSLSLTTTSSGSPQVAMVGQQGSVNSDVAMIGQPQLVSDSDNQAVAHSVPTPPSRLRTASRNSSHSSRGVRRMGKDKSVSRNRSTDQLQTQVDVLRFELAESRRMQKTSEQQDAHIHQMAQLTVSTADAI